MITKVLRVIMFTTVLLACVEGVCEPGLSEFFKELLRSGIKGPQGQDIRLDKTSIIRLWSCGNVDMKEINASQTLLPGFWSQSHFDGSQDFYRKFERVLSDADLVNANQIIIIADINAQKTWKRDRRMLQYINTLPCMIHIIKMIHRDLRCPIKYHNDENILIQLNSTMFAADIWLNSPRYSCLVSWAFIDNKWISIRQGLAPINPYIR